MSSMEEELLKQLTRRRYNYIRAKDICDEGDYKIAQQKLEKLLERLKRKGEIEHWHSHGSGEGKAYIVIKG